MVTGERPRPNKNEGAERYLKMESMGADDGCLESKEAAGEV
jgi:hypothetical protein